MKQSIFNYLDYRELINDLMLSKPKSGRGQRKQLAEVLNCQMAFITHVLNGTKDFNHEQLLKISKYFNMSDQETEFALDLLSFNRAGTKILKEFYHKRLSQIKDNNLLLKNRLKENQSLSIQDQAEYYSHWLYGAIHMASTIKPLQSLDSLKKYFNLNGEEILPVLEFLNSKGLIKFEKGNIQPGQTHLFVGADSPLANQNHMIWRAKAMNDLKSSQKDDFHYSLCFSVAEKDWPLLREKLVGAIEDCLKIIRPSAEEKLGLICMDFQKV